MTDRLTIPPDDEHNRVLVSHVHPQDWVNPTPAGRYNLVVIGAGPAGLVTAAGAGGLGAKVALVERHLMGGDCLNVGCVPSKALIHEARIGKVDFTEVMARMRCVRASLAPNDSAARFKSLGVDVYLGHARFSGHGTIEVDGQSLAFAKACIATGSRPAIPPIPGLDQINYLTNETIFNLTQLPRRLAVIGAGPIGCELAQAFARLGSEVALIEAQPRILPRDDPDAAKIVRGALEHDGVIVRVNTTISKVAPDAVMLEREGGDERIAVDATLVATGRLPNIEALNLQTAGVEYDAKGIHVDDHLRTTNHRVFAAGDVCSRHPFTHVADAHARIVLRNALFPFLPFKPRVSNLVVPWCTYTSPQIAHVGRLTDHECQTIRVDLSNVDRAVIDNERDGFLKLHLRKGTDQIIGATLVSEHAGEIISQVTTAMVHGIGLRNLARVIYPYPTVAECIKKAADAHQRTRLTPFARRVIGKLMRWQR